MKQHVYKAMKLLSFEKTIKKNNEKTMTLLSFEKINLKSKYITCYIPKGLTHPSTNPA